ncbi:MAG: hypothetical protein HY696_06560 [Deltaproteobacteria bacterium]|nr:hypothetical protein [Deltaproteobacteria bacterium]
MPTNLLALFTTPLETARIPYMITGSMAAIVYGDPRLTHDVDIVLALRTAQLPALLAAFPLVDFYAPPEDTVTAELARGQRGHFNIIHHATGFKADMYLVGRDPIHHWALSRTTTLTVGTQSVRIAPPEYVIIRKLEFFREGGSEKHLLDIRSMLAHSRAQIDQALLDQWIAQRGVRPQWDQVLIEKTP